MDVPARQTYVAVVVAGECPFPSLDSLATAPRCTCVPRPGTADERSAAGGITNIIRSLGMALAPLFVGLLSEQGKGGPWSWFSVPWCVGATALLLAPRSARRTGSRPPLPAGISRAASRSFTT